MAILLRGKTGCPLCGDVIAGQDEAVVLPAFVFNDADPLVVFSDASLHQRCAEADPRWPRVREAVDEMLAKTGPGKRRCAVCGQEIADPNDYFMLPRLVDDARHPLFRYNYTHLHKSHIPRWRDAPLVLSLLEALAGQWQGPLLETLVSSLKIA